MRRDPISIRFHAEMGPWIRSSHANCIRPVIRNDQRGSAPPIPLPSRGRLGQGFVKRSETRRTVARRVDAGGDCLGGFGFAWFSSESARMPPKSGLGCRSGRGKALYSGR